MDAILKTQAEKLASEMATQVTTLDDLQRPDADDDEDRPRTHAQHRDGRSPRSPGTPPLPPLSERPVGNLSATGDVTATPKNRRNGHSQKTVSGDMGDLTLQTPRDRNGTFEPQLIAKHQRRLGGFDEKILALYAKGHDDARHPGDRQGTLRRGGVADAGLGDHRRPRCRGHRLADAAARCGLADRLSRRHCGACAGRERPRVASTRCTWPWA